MSGDLETRKGRGRLRKGYIRGLEDHGKGYIGNGYRYSVLNNGEYQGDVETGILLIYMTLKRCGAIPVGHVLGNRQRREAVGILQGFYVRHTIRLYAEADLPTPSGSGERSAG
jgi:hypothetical protein